MKVKLLTGLMGKIRAQAGQIVDLPDSTAKKYIQRKLALPVEEKPENKKDSKVNVENRQRKRKRTTKRSTSKNTSKG